MRDRNAEDAEVARKSQKAFGKWLRRLRCLRFSPAYLLVRTGSAAAASHAPPANHSAPSR